MKRVFLARPVSHPEKQCLTDNDSLSILSFQKGNRLCRFFLGKHILGPRLGLEIDFDNIVEMLLTEHPRKVRFADLPGAPDNEGLAVWAIFPFFQEVDYASFHF